MMMTEKICPTCHRFERAVYRGARYEDVRAVIRMLVDQHQINRGNASKTKNDMMTDQWMTYREVIHLYRPDFHAPENKAMNHISLYGLRPLYRKTRKEGESFTGWVSRYFIAGER